jgi:GNAT superfamily N-acetyltransferase
MGNNSIMVNTSIHLLMSDELDATDEVVIAAYNLRQSRKNTLQRYLALQPDGAFVAQQDGTIVGFGAAKKYNSFAYIGLMAVHPAVQKQGIGHRLLEHILSWLDASGCPTVLLDATPAGAALYKHYDFVEDDTTVVLQQDREPLHNADERDGVAGRSDKSGSSESMVLRGEELPGLFLFDAPSFGSERATVLASYWADDSQRVLVTHNSEEQITGYLIAQSSVLGPWVADTVEDAERLLVYALTLPFKNKPGVFVSAHNLHALRLLDRYGFTQRRALSHMRRGEKMRRGRHTTLYGQGSLGLG